MFAKLPENKISRLREMLEYFMGKDHIFKYYGQPGGETVDIIKRGEFPDGRVGSYTMDFVTFIIIPRLLERSHVMYSPLMIGNFIDELFEDFIEKHIQNKNSGTCQNDKDLNRNNNEGTFHEPIRPAGVIRTDLRRRIQTQEC